MPKLRDDLIIGTQKSGEKSYIVIKEPESGEFFRFNEAEHFVARQLDGETPHDEVRRRAEEHFGASLSQDTLDAFIGRLNSHGLLEGGGSRSGESRGRLRGDAFYLRYKILDPNRLFNALIDPLRFFFTPPFVLAATITIGLAIITLIAHWGEYVRDVTPLLRLESLPLLVLVSFAVISLHEFAHGLTCRNFGGNVHEMGFMLIYFQPALYCNVSDAWLFPERSKRLWVGFAGPFFELFLWSLAVPMWRFTAPGSLLNDASLMVMTTSGVKTLLNFNPLIKYDGYYLLSDYLEIPNLRRRSFGYLGDRLAYIFGFPSSTRGPATQRERRILLTYGAVATAGTVVFVGGMTLIAGNLFFTGNELIAGFLFTLVGMRLRQRIKRLFRKKATNGTNGTRSASSEKEPHSRRKRRMFWIAFAGFLVLLVLFGRLELKVGGPFVILPIHNADVRSEIDGILVELRVTEGDAVEAGDIIARLSGREQESSLQQTQAQIEQTRARLRMQLAGPTREELDLARATVAKAGDRLSFARGRAERNKTLLEKGLIAQTEYETTLEQATVSENELNEARRQLALLARGTRPEEIEATRAEILRLEAQRQYLEGQMSRLEIRSPVAGIVATPARQLKAMERQLIAKGSLIAKVFNLRTLTVEIPVPENEIADVRIGQRVAFKVRAYPGETFIGSVTSIATTVTEPQNRPPASSAISGPVPFLPSGSPGSNTILVTTQVDNGLLLLKPGMTGEAKIFCGKRSILDLILRRLARIGGIELWSWW